MSWITRAGQRWKLLTGLLGMVASGVCFVLGWRLFAQCNGPAETYCRSADLAMPYMLSGLAVGLTSFLWTCLAPRCPTCGKRIVWWALSTKPGGGWLVALQRLPACPGCGDALEAGAHQ